MKRILIGGLTMGAMLSLSSMLDAQQAPEGRGQRAAFIDDNADGLADGMARMHRRGGRMAGEVRESVLTAEQQSTLAVLVGELKEGAATQEEIHAAVEDQFASWGIEQPEKLEGIARGGRGERVNPLTKQQQATISALVGELKAGEATQEEIHAAIEGQFANWGIELPEKPAGIARGGQGERISPLTEEQRATVDALVSDLRANNATPEEVRAAVEGQLSDLGVKLPERPEGKGEHARLGKGQYRESRQGVGESQVRRGMASRMDSNSIETMMLQTQGRGAR